jgi:quercetin dioxygenase-like cupin family protein
MNERYVGRRIDARGREGDDLASKRERGEEMKSKAVAALIVGLLGVGLYVGNILATPASGLTSSTVARSSFAPLKVSGRSDPAGVWHVWMKTHGLSDFYVIDNKIAPGGTTGWHSHPGPSLIYVIAGQVTNYLGDDPDCTPHVYTAGQGFVDAGGKDVHMLRNNGEIQAETVAVQFLPEGAVRRIEEPNPGNCHF